MIYNPTYEPNRFLSKVLSWRLRALLIRIDASVFYENTKFNVQEFEQFSTTSRVTKKI